MADKKAPPPKKAGNFGLIFASVFLAVIAVMMMATTLLFLVGMIPTVVAYFVDTSRQRTLGPTVFYLNFAGVLPALLKLWSQGHNINNAIALLTDPFTLLMMLAPAGVAWLLFIFVPVMVSGILRRRAEMRMQTLESDQKRLIEEWGPQITGSAAKVEKAEDAAGTAHGKSVEESFTA